jgi:hypothetical protein
MKNTKIKQSRWTKEEDAQLIELYKQGIPVNLIAGTIDRTSQAVYMRASTLRTKGMHIPVHSNVGNFLSTATKTKTTKAPKATRTVKQVKPKKEKLKHETKHETKIVKTKSSIPLLTGITAINTALLLSHIYLTI